MPYADSEKNTDSRRTPIQRRKDEWFGEHGPCALCGSAENLEVDHIDPSQKSFSIHWAIRWDILKIELAKCRALCEPCHTKLSAEQKLRSVEELKSTISSDIRNGLVPKSFIHGTRNGYLYYRCRCDLCREAVNSYARARNKLPWVKASRSAYYKAKRPSPSNGYLLGNSIQIPDRPFTHGTGFGYYKKKCRCDKCQAHADERNKRRNEVRALCPKLQPVPIIIRHGTSHAYCHHKCRCEICRDGVRQRAREKRALRPPPQPKGATPITHGRYSSYCRHACRCESCCKAAFDYREQKRAVKKGAAPL